MATHYVTINADFDAQASLGIHPGDRFEVRREDFELILRPIQQEQEQFSGSSHSQPRFSQAEWHSELERLRDLVAATAGPSTEEILSEVRQELERS